MFNCALFGRQYSDIRTVNNVTKLENVKNGQNLKIKKIEI